MVTCFCFIRGINVGKAKRVAMADLRELLEELGHNKVRSLLNSGNLVFESKTADLRALSTAIRSAMLERCGVDAEVLVIDAAQMQAILNANPLTAWIEDPSKFLVAFVADPALLQKCQPLLAQDWSPDRIALGEDAAYLHCANGILESKLLKAFNRTLPAGATTRNWATVLKLVDLLN